ncbi:MAG: hypothetical protein HRU15_12250, partial [Planctomycetes bacterium]|nr:hypothetical protein [Planctomycetota bacterium]
GIADPNKNVLDPEDSGIWSIDLETGAADLIISINDVAGIPNTLESAKTGKHYFNHLLINPHGTRFIFLHRWVAENGGFVTRMMTANIDGSDICIVDDSGHSSHFYWQDDKSILIFTKPRDKEHGFYLFDARTGLYSLVIDDPHNGHCVYLPGNQWILNDTYPIGNERRQNLYLYHVATGKRIELGSYPAPEAYCGEWRCDLHARFSRDGKKVLFDSAHGGNGRQQYLIDLDTLI